MEFLIWMFNKTAIDYAREENQQEIVELLSKGPSKTKSSVNGSKEVESLRQKTKEQEEEIKALKKQLEEKEKEYKRLLEEKEEEHKKQLEEIEEENLLQNQRLMDMIKELQNQS